MSTKHYSGPAKASAGRRRERSAGAELFSEDAWKAIGQSLKFSGRELEIVRGIFEDRTEYTIAADLNISPHTVHTHVDRLHHKLHVANRVQLVLRVTETFLSLTLSPQTNLPPICANWQVGVCPLARANG
ncbi:MAG: helix-turn-helix transcriptional regulator [Verrucomicrobia bacterium]|jgi:DNA-binding NarL/FixJ family response regulator|nr:helix-turn-helix transcriptional regulator [Verrucomicrobiota bacterium]